MRILRRRPYPITRQWRWGEGWSRFARPSWRGALVLTLLVGLVGIFCTFDAVAHYDPPSPPRIWVEIRLAAVILTQDQDDGVDGNAELLLTINVNHQGHGSKTSRFTKYDYDWDFGGWWHPKERIWDHKECSPRNPVIVVAQLLEIDTMVTDQVLGAIGSAVAGAAIGVAVGSPVGAVVGGAAGVVVSLAGCLNGNDDLGLGSALLPTNDLVEISLQGQDGSASIWVSDTTETLIGDGRCECTGAFFYMGDLLSIPPLTMALQDFYPQLSGTAHMVPMVSVEDPPTMAPQYIYPPLSAAAHMVPMISAEECNPANLSDEDLKYIRLTLLRTIFGLAETFAGIKIEKARGYLGVDEAINHFEEGQKQWSTDPTAAIASFEQAYIKASIAAMCGNEACDNGVCVIKPCTDKGSLRLQLSLAPDYISTKAYRNPLILATVLGATGPTELSVQDLPKNVEAEVTRVSHDANTFTIELDIGNAKEGRYTPTLCVIMNSVPMTAKKLVLVIN